MELMADKGSTEGITGSCGASCVCSSFGFTRLLYSLKEVVFSGDRFGAGALESDPLVALVWPNLCWAFCWITFEFSLKDSWHAYIVGLDELLTRTKLLFHATQSLLLFFKMGYE